MVIYNKYCRLSRYDFSASVGGSSHSAVSPLGCDWHGFRKDISKSDSNGFPDRCTDETAYSTGTESVARALEVLVNQYDWLPGPLTFRQAVLFHVPALSLSIFAGATCVMALVSLFACLLPSQRAARISPMEALAEE